LYFSANQTTAVGLLINNMNLSQEQVLQLKSILDGALTDMCYSILLGLDGEAQIGNRQEVYKIYAEDGTELTGGEIEGYAWEYFHNKE
jgi:hypothetical protein